MRNKNKYINNTQLAHHGHTKSKQCTFVSVQGAYFEGNLKSTTVYFPIYDENEKEKMVC